MIQINVLQCQKNLRSNLAFLRLNFFYRIAFWMKCPITIKGIVGKQKADKEVFTPTNSSFSLSIFFFFETFFPEFDHNFKKKNFRKITIFVD